MTQSIDGSSYDESPVLFAAGNDSLFGMWTEPRGPRSGVAVTMVPGAGYLSSSHRNRMYVRLARALAAQGHHVLRFDYHGVGESDGTVAGFSLDAPFTSDAEAAIRWVEAQGLTRHVLVGSCFGARTMLAAAASVRDLRGVVLVSPPVRDFERGEETAIEWNASRLIRRLTERETMRGLLDAERRRVYRRFAATKVRELTSNRRGAGGNVSYTSPTFHAPLRDLVRRRVPVFLYFGTADGLWQHFERAREADLGPILHDAGDLVTVDVFEGELHNFANLASQRALVESVPRWIAGALQER